MKSGYFKAAAFFPVLFFAAFAPRVFAAPPIDAVAGVPVFLDGKIWSESPEELKSRLKIGGGETKTRDGGILSCAIGQKIFGVDANEIKFEYTNGKISSVKIVFFNKGDSVKNGKWNSQTAAKMRSDARELFKKLSAAFGAAENSHIGVGAAKIRAKQWNCPSATIRVAFEDKEFIIMQAVPPAALAEKPAEKQQASGKKNLADSVEKSANGDVVVNVPMVNQGAKGYCFPATVERLLLHNGLADIDMHKLADLFKTGVGGGTTLDNAADAISKIARANKLKFGGAKRDFSQISKNIDAGVPMLWLMFSPAEYVSARRARTKEREAADFKEWVKICRKERKPKIGGMNADSAHVCLVVGYNRATKELAVSDSWSDGDVAPSWISFETFKAVSQDCPLFFVSPR